MQLSPLQAQAVSDVTRWYREGAEPVYRLFGFAGTGKTTLARHIVEALGADPVRYAAYTGKAAHVLRTKGCDAASTIHSLIYMPKIRAREALRAMEAELDREKRRALADRDQIKIQQLESRIRAERERLAVPSFLLRNPAESILTGSQLCVVDEVSMVNERMARDLLGFDVPLLVLGDPAQLPPVEGGGWFIDKPADSLLTEVHRSALDSPVTRIATTIRGAVPGIRGYGVTGLDGDSGRVRDLPVESLKEFDQVLVGTNATRWQAISMLRSLHGLEGDRPVRGDRIIILANNGECDVFNGQQFTVEDASHSRDRHTLLVTGEDGPVRELLVYPWGFRDADGEKRARWVGGRGEVAAATFAWAVTVHKAQGSQWPAVLCVDESHVFERMARGSAAERHRAGQRWLYTAATRASDRVVLCGTGAVRS